MTAFTVTKFLRGFYRVTGTDCRVYGNVRKKGKLWEADLHNAETGDHVRPAGIWSTKKSAVEECQHLLPKTFVISRPE